jgi:hypothetical protein
VVLLLSGYTRVASGRKSEKWLLQLQSDDATRRREAARRLGKRHYREAVLPLCQSLQDGDWRVRAAAASALGAIGLSEAVEPLLAALDDKTTTVRKKAAEALGKIGNQEAIESLCTALGDKKGSVRENALDALVLIGPASVSILCQYLDDDNLHRRYHVTLALCRLYEAEKWTTIDRIFGDRHLTPQQRWQGLEAIRAARPSRLAFGWLRDIYRLCEETIKLDERTQEEASMKARGAQQVMEYMTLARPTQRDFATEREMLLRAAQETEVDDGADILLRGSAPENGEIFPRRQTLFSRIIPWILARLRRPH